MRADVVSRLWPLGVMALVLACVDWEGAERSFCNQAARMRRTGICGFEEDGGTPDAGPSLFNGESAVPGHVAWAKVYGGPGPISVSAMSGEVGGSVWVTGGFSGQAVFGNVSHQAAGDSDAFVARLGPNGERLFSADLGGPQLEQGLGIAADDTGFAYATGTFWSPSVPLGGGTVLLNGGLQDSYVIRFDPSGQAVASLQLARSVGTMVTAAGIAASNGAVVAGGFNGSVGTADLQISSGPGTQLFVFGLTPNLAYRWHAHSLGCDFIVADAVATDATGATWVLGHGRGASCWLGDVPVSFPPNDSSAFLAKFPANAAGVTSVESLTWLGSINEGDGMAFAANAVGDTAFILTNLLHDQDGGTAYFRHIQRFRQDGGTPLNIVLSQDTNPIALDMDDTGTLWLAADQLGGFYGARLDSAQGLLDWWRYFPPGSSGRAVSLDRSGNLTMAGEMSTELFIGSSLLPAPQGRGFFLLRMYR